MASVPPNEGFISFNNSSGSRIQDGFFMDIINFIFPGYSLKTMPVQNYSGQGQPIFRNNNPSAARSSASAAAVNLQIALIVLK